MPAMAALVFDLQKDCKNHMQAQKQIRSISPWRHRPDATRQPFLFDAPSALC